MTQTATHLLIPESDLIIAIGVLIFFRSHTLADRSSDPLTILSPDAKAAEVTELSLEETFSNSVMVHLFGSN